MTDFRRLVVGPLGANCYVVWDKPTLKAAIVDPGGDELAIAEAVESGQLLVEWILLTHVHPDHTFAAPALARRFHARTGIHWQDALRIPDMLDVAGIFYDLADYEPLSPTDLLSDGDRIRLGESEMEVLHSPGHSPGGVCFVTSAGVFCGDTIFADGVGRWDFPGGAYEDLMTSIKTRLLTMDDATPLHPGHGASTTVGHERENNPYLQ